MTKKLFVAAVGQDSGKTTTSLCLLHLARLKYQRIGYIKPFGAKSVTYRDLVVDKDVALMAEVFDLTQDLYLMSPVVVFPETTHQFIDGLIPPAELQDKIRKAYAALESRCDFIIIEGSGHPGVGSILQLSNARIARMLDAPVLLVTGGGLGSVVDELDPILALFEKEGCDVRAILVNKLNPEKRERSLDYLQRALKRLPLRVIGGFDYHPVLANPTLDRIAWLLGLPLHGNREDLHRIIHQVQVGAASTYRVAELLQVPTLLIANSSRDQLLVTMAHLYRMPQYHDKIVGLVISGSLPISAMTQQILDDSFIPYMRAENQVSAELYRKITKDVSKITAADTEKLELIWSLSEQGFNFNEIDELFSLPAVASPNGPIEQQPGGAKTSDSPLLQSVVVGCLVRNASNEVLLIRHYKRGWEIPQGRVERGENLMDALHREVREETGVEIEPGPLVAVWSMLSPPTAQIFTFLGRYLSGELAPTGDSVEAIWLTEAEALAKVESPVMNDRLKTLLEYQGRAVYRAYTTRPYQVQMERVLGE
ncbi:MAG: AAA family ATPase [Desulfuromonadales bacterium]|nr:AAA family ATPase [Desulfuromonadales bacterium]